MARGELQIAQFARVLDDHLASRDWMIGTDLTLADLAIAVPLMATVPAKLPLLQYGNLQARYARVQQLDCSKQTALNA